MYYTIYKIYAYTLCCYITYKVIQMKLIINNKEIQMHNAQ